LDVLRGDADRTSAESGQAVVLMTVAFIALLAFVGLVTDVASLYTSYTQLKRAVDAAAVAAANNIKNPSLTYSQRKTRITEAAREMIALHNIADISTLDAYTCDDAAKPADFAAVCPDTGAGEDPRKLAWVQATQNAPVYFLSLFGVQSVPLTTSSIGEAATVDLVVVIDTSESMGEATPGYGPDFNPSACNAANSCQPLRTAKDAAKDLVDSLFEGYDRVAVVGFDFDATMYSNLEDDFTVVKNAIDSIPLHDDLDASVVVSYGNPAAGDMNPLDVDGDGFSELVIRAYGNDFNGAAYGKSYLILTGNWVDMDGDGYSESMGDCNDNSAAQNPGMSEIPNNGIDDDCQFGDLRFVRHFR
jgi:Flp pilus assembly protein TadG